MQLLNSHSILNECAQLKWWLIKAGLETTCQSTVPTLCCAGSMPDLLFQLTCVSPQPSENAHLPQRAGDPLSISKSHNTKLCLPQPHQWPFSLWALTCSRKGNTSEAKPPLPGCLLLPVQTWQTNPQETQPVPIQTTPTVWCAQQFNVRRWSDLPWRALTIHRQISAFGLWRTYGKMFKVQDTQGPVRASF
jgi:hypothetical protein